MTTQKSLGIVGWLALVEAGGGGSGGREARCFWQMDDEHSQRRWPAKTQEKMNRQ